jgi:hypothetical protein
MPIVMAVVMAFLTNGLVYAGRVSDRAALDSLLAGYGSVTETFETALVPPSSFLMVTPPVLNHSTSVPGYGTGLVLPGVSFLGPSGNALQLNSGGYYGQPSQDLLSGYMRIDVDFNTPTRAVGLDLLVFEGYSDSATVKVYGPDDTTLLDSYSGISISSPADFVFFGYEDDGGIGMIEISGANYTWTPILDNVTFVQVPEPSALALVACGAAAWLISRRRR